MTFSNSASRATSPTPSLLPFRLSSQPDTHQSPTRKGRDSRSSDFFSAASGRIRRASTQSKPKDKGKDILRGDGFSETSSNFGIIDRDPFASHQNAHTTFFSYDRARPATSDGHSSTMPRKSKGNSLFVAASDALGIKFGKRRSIRQPPPLQMPMILPDVIEISAARKNEELEERNRLREQAAQAIGLGPFMVQPDAHSRDDSLTEEDEEGDCDRQPNPYLGFRRLGDVRNSESAPNIASKSPHDSSISVIGTSPPNIGRYRSGSMQAHSRTNSATLTPIPSFPCALSSLTAFTQSSATLPKYYPPSSLRIFALSKSWKIRFLVLSSPTALMTRSSGPAVSYLHLFKSSQPDEKEMERLEINEDSVVFVAEEEVGGRKHVIKVGGVDVGAMKKDLNHEDNGRTMWLLQITNQAEAQKWITAIKNAVLGQRSLRAGLPSTSLSPGSEPRGDMDVMLSIRAQGLITSPTSMSPTSPRSPQLGTSPPQSLSQDRNYASSVSSHSIRSQSTVPKSTASGPVSTLKGLFSAATRPRSASRAASIESERQQQEREQNEESFASMGSNLLKLRSSTPDIPPHSPTISSTPFGRAMPAPPAAEHLLDRKIVERQPLQWVTNDPPAPIKTRADRAMSLGALSLQPAPRKRWTSMSQSTTPNEQCEFQIANDDRSINEKTETEPTFNPRFSFGSGEASRPRAPSLQSVSTYTSENAFSIERSSSSTKRSSKRWSRQLPHRLTPPAGPPPLAPSNSSVTRLHAHPYAAERPPSRASDDSESSQKSVLSGLPSFSKRASGSSAFSVKSTSTIQSNTSSLHSHRPSSSHRSSMPPPPRPPPTFALPPAPNYDLSPVTDPAPSNSSKSSFRSSMANRSFRLSMGAPKPPPSTVLPPRPDEPQLSKTHRRRSSSGGNARASQLDSIPGSPVPPSVVISPFPPPHGPLPPTPVTSTTFSNDVPVSVSRHTSLKQRLRILSAPSPSNHSPPPLSPAYQTELTLTPVQLISTPITPIAEKITSHQNDLSFLQLQTPITPSLPSPRPLLTPPEPEITYLSPPPRRGSKQISVIETEMVENPPPLTEEKTPDGERRMMSLSRPGSVVSLSVVNV
ncbi:hypothetical protein BDQ17DRAFT_1343429 [Cyathus striatus]|nr:hypothetical protein BDQ17DRAFT_1343429 [Cyathus striatus]